MTHRLLAVLHARNMEFLRDRASLGWNLLLPVLLVIGLSLIFAGPERDQFKVGVITHGATLDASPHPFLGTRHVGFIATDDAEHARRQLSRHQLDMLIDAGPPPRYWINADSKKGYFLEKLLLASGGETPRRQTVSGRQVRYIDWVLPGILGMNMMFSSLFGVGYVVVRYRKSGYLKRLHATPLRAFEFVAAQIASRLILVTAVTTAVYAGSKYFIGFTTQGSHLLLLLTALAGALAMISLGFVVAARVSSEELAGGLLNVLSWPMMLLSGVWFSMEGSPEWLQQLTLVLPLTHLLAAARGIMIDGAGLADITPNITALLAMSALCIACGAVLFRWRTP